MFHLRKPVPHLCLLAAVCLAAASCAQGEDEPGLKRSLALKPCVQDLERKANLAAIDALCGTLEVWENRKTKNGRKIALNIAVIPALAAQPKPDPIFILAGGPGQAATEIDWVNVFPWAKKLRIHRDIVLVDQRGTGASNPLDCNPDGGVSLQRMFEPRSDEAIEKARRDMEACVEEFDADPHQYTTDVAMDDLDEVRTALGYAEINIWGGSYGTRAAHVYLRRHGETVRSAVLSGVAPLEMKIMMDAAEDGDRALAMLFSDCEKDPACRDAFPELRDNLKALLTRLNETPEKVQLSHPRTGEIEEVTIGPETVRMLLFSSLYDTQRSALIPLAVKSALAGDFRVFAALAEIGVAFQEEMSAGMQAAVLCNEDLAGVKEGSVDAGPKTGVFSQEEMVSIFKLPCPFYEGADLPASYFAPVTSDVPTLILSGDLDPITPPRWGKIASRNLRRSKHIVVPGTGHGVSHYKCVSDMVVTFIEEASADNLDTACLKDLSRFPIFLRQSGPFTAPKKGK
jgi:pimeloyl-ACP methyl ester carboxylesterase